MSSHNDFPHMAWGAMEKAYHEYIRQLWDDSVGGYREEETGQINYDNMAGSHWMGLYHIFCAKHRLWEDAESTEVVRKIIDLTLREFTPVRWDGHGAVVEPALRFLAVAYRYRQELNLSVSTANLVRARIYSALERHFWVGCLEHEGQSLQNLLLTPVWNAYRAFGDPLHWEWLLHIFSEIKERHHSSYVDDISGKPQQGFVQPDLLWNYVQVANISEGHPVNLHTPNYHDTMMGAVRVICQEVFDQMGYRDPDLEHYFRLTAPTVLYDWMYDGSPSWFSDGYGIQRIHHSHLWASMLEFLIGLVYHDGSGSLRGVARFLLEQFVRALSRYDVFEGDPEDGALPPAYFGTQHVHGTKLQSNALWLEKLARSLVEYKIDQVPPQVPTCWTDFRFWNQGMHFSGSVFDLGVIGYQLSIMRESRCELGMLTSLGEPTIRDSSTGKYVVPSSVDPPNYLEPHSGADFLLEVAGAPPTWASAITESRRARRFLYRSSKCPEWMETLTPYSCHELDGKRLNPHYADTLTEVIAPSFPRFQAINLVRATRDVVVQLSQLLCCEGTTYKGLTLTQSAKYYGFLRGEEEVVVHLLGETEERLTPGRIHRCGADADKQRVQWFWVRYPGYGALFVPVWSLMYPLSDDWELGIDLEHCYQGEFLSTGIGSYFISTMPEGQLTEAPAGTYWQTVMLIRPTLPQIKDARARASFLLSNISLDNQDGSKAVLGKGCYFIPDQPIPGPLTGNHPWDLVVDCCGSPPDFVFIGIRGEGTLTVTLQRIPPDCRLRVLIDRDDLTGVLDMDRPTSDCWILSIPVRAEQKVKVTAD